MPFVLSVKEEAANQSFSDLRPFPIVSIFTIDGDRAPLATAIFVDKELNLFVTPSYMVETENARMLVNNTLYLVEIRDEWIDWDKGIAIVRPNTDGYLYFPDVFPFNDSLVLGSQVLVSALMLREMPDGAKIVEVETVSAAIEQFDADWTIFGVDTNNALKAFGKNSVEEIPKQERFYLYNRYILLKAGQGYEFPYGFGGAVVSEDNRFEGMYFYADSIHALIVPSYEIKPLLERAQTDLRQYPK